MPARSRSERFILASAQNKKLNETYFKYILNFRLLFWAEANINAFGAGNIMLN
jgi:hypothetical protein